MLPVILSSSGIVRDFIKLSDKALKPSLAGDYPGCRLVFSNSIFCCSCWDLFWGFFCFFSVISTSLFLSLSFVFFLCELANSSTPPMASFSPSHSLVSMLALKTKSPFVLKKQKNKHLCCPLCFSCLFLPAVLLVSSHTPSGINCSITYIKSLISSVPCLSTSHVDILPLQAL